MLDLGEALDRHVTLRLECPDRIYLNGYVPILQVGGQVVRFLCDQRGAPIPSPALLGQMTRAFVQAVEGYAASTGSPSAGSSGASARRRWSDPTSGGPSGRDGKGWS